MLMAAGLAVFLVLVLVGMWGPERLGGHGYGFGDLGLGALGVVLILFVAFVLFCCWT